MREKITDMSEALLAITEEVRLLRENIDSQHADICWLNRNIDRLKADLRKRDKRIKELEDRLAKYENLGKNSGNSNTPPSKENMKAEASSAPRPCAS